MFRNVKICLFISILISSCVTPTFEPDLSLLRPWGEELAREEPYKTSYVAKFKKDDKELFYIAGHHAKSPDADVFPLIKKSFSEFDPEVLILEGFIPEVTQERMRERAKKCSPNFERCGEKYFAIYLAKSDVELVTGEPSEKEILESMKRLKYTTEDLAFYYLVRQIPSWERQKEINVVDFKKQAEEFLDVTMIKRFYSTEIENGFDKFKVWYKEKMGKEFSLDDIDSEVPAPHKDGHYLQKMGYQVGLVRDSNVVKMIAKQLEKHKKVMVLYGGSHLVVEVKVLEKMLGKPIYTN
jgi:hypothetical protein